MRFTAVLAGAVASAFTFAPAYAEDLVIMLDNQSSEAVSEFYVSSVDSESWEEAWAPTCSPPARRRA